MKYLCLLAVVLIAGCTGLYGAMEKHMETDSDAFGIYIKGAGPGFGAAGNGTIMAAKVDQGCRCTVQVGTFIPEGRQEPISGVFIFRLDEPKPKPATMSADISP